MLSDKQGPDMDDQVSRDLGVTRQTVVHLHTLTIEQGKRLAEVERHVRDIKFGVLVLMVGAVAVIAHLIWKG